MGRGAYYNEIEPFAADWLRNLIAGGHLPAGDVDERSIVDVRADDLRGYGACHFFAGIGGWPLALRLAGVPDAAPVWTGSCPCQPFSVAGRGAGTADERHLWPAFHALITERRPAIVLGEQTAGAAGRLWLAGVRADLEHVGYAVGAADLAAASVGAPHIRQRLYWLAHAKGDGGRPGLREGNALIDGNGAAGNRATGGLGNAFSSRVEGLAGDGDGGGESGRDDPLTARPVAAPGGGFWDDFDLVPFPDGRVRRIESGTTPLATGIPGRLGRLRAYGNAICVPLAAEFVRAWIDCRGMKGLNG